MRKIVLVCVLGIVALGLLTIAVFGQAAAEAKAATPCIGQVKVFHEAGVETGLATIALPAKCQTGTYFLTAESLEEGRPVIVNGWLHQGSLVIRTTHLEPPIGPVNTIVNYQVLSSE